MTTLLVLNPAAGRGHAARLRSAVENAAALHWRDVRLIETHAPGEAVALVRAEVEQHEVSRVLVIGGDGTLHEVANGLLSATVRRLPALSVIPAGTGNDYAKLLGTHGLEPAEAVARLARGRVEYFDVGHAWEEYFINSIGIGFDAEVALRVNRMRHLRGPLAYLVAVLQAYSGFSPFQAVVEGGGQRFDERWMLLEIGNGPCVGGGFKLTPHARPDNGVFDVCAIRRLTIFGFLTKIPLAMLGWHTHLRQVRSFQATSLVVHRAEGTLTAQLDGEVRAKSGRIEIRIEPGRLPVLLAAPRPSPQWQQPAEAS